MGFSRDFKPEILMVTTQVLYSMMNILFKLVIATGMNLNVFVAYRLLFAAAFMVPLAFILERSKKPKLTWAVLSQGFLCGAIGAAVPQNLYIESVSLMSPTFLAAISNLLPAVTFVIAVCLGQERLALKKASSLAKILGTLIGIGGAMVFSLYKGPEFTIWTTNIDLLEKYRNNNSTSTLPGSGSTKYNPALGSLAGFGSTLCSAIWLILQARMSDKFPYPYTSTALLCTMGCIQSVAFAFWAERDWDQWRMGWEWDIKIWTAAYSGIIISGGTMVMMSWSAQKRGALFVAVFNPMTLLIVSIASSLFLEENFTVGRVLGGVLTVCGLYIVLWGKSKENPPQDCCQTPAQFDCFQTPAQFDRSRSSSASIVHIL